MWKQRRFFDQRNTLMKVRGNNMDFSIIEITSKKVRGNNVDFSTIKIASKKVHKNNVDSSTIEITSKKVRGNNVDFLTSEITQKKVRGSNMDFLTSEIMSKKVRGNDLDFSISQITSKKYVEMTWKIVEIWSSTYRCTRWVDEMFIEMLLFQKNSSALKIFWFRPSVSVYNAQSAFQVVLSTT